MGPGLRGCGGSGDLLLLGPAALPYKPAESQGRSPSAAKVGGGGQGTQSAAAGRDANNLSVAGLRLSYR